MSRTLFTEVGLPGYLSSIISENGPACFWRQITTRLYNS